MYDPQDISWSQPQSRIVSHIPNQKLETLAPRCIGNNASCLADLDVEQRIQQQSAQFLWQRPFNLG